MAPLPGRGLPNCTLVVVVEVPYEQNRPQPAPTAVASRPHCVWQICGAGGAPEPEGRPCPSCPSLSLARNPNRSPGCRCPQPTHCTATTLLHLPAPPSPPTRLSLQDHSRTSPTASLLPPLADLHPRLRIAANTSCSALHTADTAEAEVTLSPPQPFARVQLPCRLRSCSSRYPHWREVLRPARRITASRLSHKHHSRRGRHTL